MLYWSYVCLYQFELMIEVVVEMDRENSSVPHLSDGTAIYSCIITARDNGTIRLSNSKMVCVFCVFCGVYLINVQRQIYSMPINYYCKKCCSSYRFLWRRAILYSSIALWLLTAVQYRCDLLCSEGTNWNWILTKKQMCSCHTFTFLTDIFECPGW